MNRGSVTVYSLEAHDFYKIVEAFGRATTINGGPVEWYSPLTEGAAFDIHFTLPDPKGTTPLTLTAHKHGMTMVGVSLTYGGPDGAPAVPATEDGRAAKMLALVKERAAALNIDIPG